MLSGFDFVMSPNCLCFNECRNKCLLDNHCLKKITGFEIVFLEMVYVYNFSNCNSSWLFRNSLFWVELKFL